MCIELLPRENEYTIVRKTGSNEEVKEFLKDFDNNAIKHFIFDMVENDNNCTYVNYYYNKTFVTKIYDQYLEKYYDKVIIYYSSQGHPFNITKLEHYINMDQDSDNNIALVLINYDHPIGNLPSTIKSLHLEMNQYIHNDGKTQCYEHPLDSLPVNLEILSLSATFNGNLDFLPIGLLQLELNDSCSSSLDNLPCNLYCLMFNSRNDMPLFHLPRSLKILILSENYQTELKNLPDLKTLYIGCDYYRPLINLPESLEELTIIGNPFEIVLPKNLKNIEFGFKSHSIPCWLPDSIETIYIYSSNINSLFNQLDEYIPYNLKELNINPFLYDIELDPKQQELIDWLTENNVTVNMNQ
jgi:hypothetical protein